MENKEMYVFFTEKWLEIDKPLFSISFYNCVC